VEWNEEEATFASRRRLVADKGGRKPAHMGQQVHVGGMVTVHGVAHSRAVTGVSG
jgi:hypothetical protein